MTTITIPDTGTQLSVRKVYTVGAVSTDVFNIPFPYFDEGDIKVYEGTPVPSLLTISTDYTVAGTAVDGGFSSGDVTLTAGVTNTTVIVERSIDVQRITDFLTTGPFPMAALNLALDNVYAVLQEQRSKIDRTVRLADEDPTSTVVLPSTDDRKGNYLFFDDTTGAPVPAQNLTTGAAVVTPLMVNVLQDATGDDALTTLGVTAFMLNLIDDATEADAWATLGIPGGLLDIQEFTATGLQVYTMPAGATHLEIFLVAGGGGGGNASNTSASTPYGGSAGGGSGGGAAHVLVPTTGGTTPINITIGAGGAGATVAAATGSAGSDSTFNFPQATLQMTVKGGLGGAGCTTTAVNRFQTALGGNPPAAHTPMTNATWSHDYPGGRGGMGDGVRSVYDGTNHLYYALPSPGGMGGIFGQYSRSSQVVQYSANATDVYAGASGLKPGDGGEGGINLRTGSATATTDNYNGGAGADGYCLVRAYKLA